MSLRHSLLATAVLTQLLHGSANADVITLRGGNQIRGLVLDHKSSDSEIRLLTAQRELTLSRSQVVEVKADASPEKRYEEATKLLKKDDAAARFELARWCEAIGLADQAKTELEGVVRIEPDHASARQLLGFVKRNGAWVKLDELPAKPGAEDGSAERKADGPALSAPGAEPLDDPVANNAESLAARRNRWLGEVHRIIKGLESGNADRTRAAREQLAEVKDPMAVPALLRALGTVSQENRGRLIEAIAGIAGPEATGALAVVAVTDPSPDLRWLATDRLRGRDARAYRPALVAALRSSNREVILNAAEAAAELGDVSLSPHLIGVLTTEATSSYQTAGYSYLTLVPKELAATRH